MTPPIHRVLAFSLPLLLSTGAAAEPLRVLVSVPPQAWLVEAIGQENVEVETLLAPGESPETFQPTDADVSRALRARVYFRIGVPFERGHWFRALEAAGSPEIVDAAAGVRRVELGHGAPEEPHHGHHHHHHDGDPHVWLGPERLLTQAANVERTLSRLDPAHTADYHAGGRRLVAELDALAEDLAATLAPHRGRSFFVFHPAWTTFAEEVGLVQRSIQVDGQEPSDAELTRLVVAARASGVRTVFVQPQVHGWAARAVADAVGARPILLDPLARDVPTNLRAVAARIAESFGP